MKEVSLYQKFHHEKLAVTILYCILIELQPPENQIFSPSFEISCKHQAKDTINDQICILVSFMIATTAEVC